MISSHYDINVFIDQVQDKPYDTVILLADEEATSAERIYLHNPLDFPPDKQSPKVYARQLKELIKYLRYDAASSALNRCQMNLLENVKDSRKSAYFSAA